MQELYNSLVGIAMLVIFGYAFWKCHSWLSEPPKVMRTVISHAQAYDLIVGNAVPWLHFLEEVEPVNSRYFDKDEVLEFIYNWKNN